MGAMSLLHGKHTSEVLCLAILFHKYIQHIPVSGEYQSKLTLMSESLRNDGKFGFQKQRRYSFSRSIQKMRRLLLERRYPAFGNLVPRDIASRAAKERCDAGFGAVT